MARTLTPEGPAGTPALRPQASPVDTFIRPVAPGGSSLGQLAAALSSVAPELGHIAGGLAEREAATESAKGEAWAADMENSKETWGKLAADGKIAPAQNPHFVLAAKRKLGQVAGSRFTVTLQQNLAKLGDAPTPEAFEAAVADARKSFLTDTAGASANDLAFMQGFNGTAEPQIDAARRAFAQDNAKQFVENASRAYFAAAHKMADDGIASGVSLDTIASQLNNESSAWAGVNPQAKRGGTLSATSLENMNAEIVFALMKSTGNPKIAEQLARKIKNGDGVLYDSAAYQARAHDVADHVTGDQRTKEAEEEQKQKRSEADAVDSARDTILSRWKQGGAVDTSDVEAELGKVGVKDPKGTALALLNKMPELDPTFFVGFRSQIARGGYPDIASLDAAARAHRITDSQYNSLLGDMTAARNAERTLAQTNAATTEQIWGHPAMKIIEDGIRQAAAAKAKKGPLGEIISYAGFTENDVAQAVAQAKIDLAQNLAANWTKYGSAANVATLASQVWRHYAFQNKIINADEALDRAPVLAADPMKSSQQQQHRASDSTAAPVKTVTPPAPGNARVQEPSYTRTEIQTIRSQYARWPQMSPDERRAFLLNPRTKAILTELGNPASERLGSALADAELSAKR